MFTQLVRRFAWCRQGNTSVFLTSSGLFACLERTATEKNLMEGLPALNKVKGIGVTGIQGECCSLLLTTEVLGRWRVFRKLIMELCYSQEMEPGLGKLITVKPA